MYLLDTNVVSELRRPERANPRPERDGLIAATADIHHLTVVTRNIRDFPDVPTLNPWE
jgi:predicted nucleic acid-binding protein